MFPPAQDLYQTIEFFSELCINRFFKIGFAALSKSMSSLWKNYCVTLLLSVSRSIINH